MRRLFLLFLLAAGLQVLADEVASREQLRQARSEFSALQAQIVAERASLLERIAQAREAVQTAEVEAEAAMQSFEDLVEKRQEKERQAKQLQHDYEEVFGAVTLALVSRYGFELPDEPVAEFLSCQHELYHPMARACKVIGPSGELQEGMALELGPLCYFANDTVAGLLDISQEGGYAHLRVVSPARQQAIRELMQGGKIVMVPVDITGTAQFEQSEKTQWSLWMHLRQGGVMMLPLGVLAWFCLMVMLDRLWFFWRHPMAAELRLVVETPEAQREAVARERVHLAQRFLAALAVVAAIAPLVGLLGTVTGMIHTFQTISQVGSGDARQLANGISEALVTTEGGLLIALPAMLFHAWCRQRVKRLAQALAEKCEM